MSPELRLFSRLRRFFPLAVAAYWYAQAAAADLRVYRCEVDGVVEFRQTQCRGGERTRVRVVEGSRGMTPCKPGLSLKKRSPRAVNTTAREPAHRRSEKACWNRRWQLRRIERKLRTGYRASQHRRLHERQEEHESYLRRFCP